MRRMVNGSIVVPESRVQSMILSFLARLNIPANRVNGGMFKVGGSNKRNTPYTRSVRCNSMNGKADIEAWLYAENDEGIRIGVPLYIEVKASSGGRQSENQKVFEEMLVKTGHNYVVARSIEDVYTKLKEMKIFTANHLKGFDLNIGRVRL